MNITPSYSGPETAPDQPATSDQGIDVDSAHANNTSPAAPVDYEVGAKQEDAVDRLTAADERGDRLSAADYGLDAEGAAADSQTTGTEGDGDGENGDAAGDSDDEGDDDGDDEGDSNDH